MSTKLTIGNPLDWRSRALLAESEEERLRAEHEQLRAALKRFGNHQMTCSYFLGKERGTCDCGFDKALARPKDG